MVQMNPLDEDNFQETVSLELRGEKVRDTW